MIRATGQGTGVLFEGLVDADGLIAPVREAERRFIHLLEFGFREGGSFEEVIQGTRVQWVLKCE